MKRKFAKCILIAINAFSILFLLYFGWLYLAHDKAIVHPSAMLPMENWERAGMLLSIGVIPMVIVNTLTYFAFKAKKSITRVLVYIPGLVCLLLVISYWM